MAVTDELISQSDSSSIYLLKETVSGRRAIRKILNRKYPSQHVVKHFSKEFDLLQGLDIQGVRKVYRCEVWNNQPALVLEYVDGTTVDQLYPRGIDNLGDFLELAIAIAQVVEHLHASQIIHNDLNGSHIVVNPGKPCEVTLIDFGNAAHIGLNPPQLNNPEQIPGDLQFISPEQTGRMNRAVDNRSDLYSLGILFYKLLTGTLPYRTSDPMVLVHCHIAVVAPPPADVNELVPLPVSQIVMKLLAKDPDARYQSAFGLRADLLACQEQLVTEGAIAPFPIGRRDRSGHFKINDKLYGREKEEAQLLSAFEQVGEGAVKLVLVAGYSGTGKTSLVNKTQQVVTAHDGVFINGKYDQFQRNIPYSGVVQAFEQHNSHILSADEQTLSQWRDRLQRALGSEGRVLTDIMPNLALILGDQPPVPELAGKEAQNRFIYMFRNFTRAIVQTGHPLLLFLDDLQWSDLASLELLKALVTDPEGHHLLCVCAYRDNEISPTHPMIKILEQLAEEQADIEQIQVGNLSLDDTNQLLADSLQVSTSQSLALTDMVYGKTKGNAFFLRQFLMSLFQEGYLVYQFQDCQWHWNIGAISELDMTDNVVDLMTRKIRRLDSVTQRVLTMAACIGNQFDVSTLTLICEMPLSDIQRILNQCHQEGLLKLIQHQAVFVHDRVQQAAYSLTPEAGRPSLHLRIGRLLLDGIEEGARAEYLFDIVNQLNKGIHLVDSQEERVRFAELNLEAGVRAKSSAAYAPALDYFTTGYSLLGADAWQHHYALALALSSEQADAAYLTGEFEQMDVCVANVLAEARTLLDKVKAYETRILAFKARNQLLDAINTGLDILAQLGVYFPESPTPADTAQALADFQSLMASRTSEELLALPEMSDPAMIAVLNIMTVVNSSIYWARADLFPFMVFKFVELSLRYGNTATSAFGYSTYGVILSGVVGDMKRAHDFGMLGLNLIDRFDAREWLTQLYTPHYALIVPWNEHTRTTLDPLVESYHIGFETGAIEYAIINANIYCIHAFLCGQKLDTLQSEIDSYSQMMQACKQETNYQFNQIYHQCVLNLMGSSSDPVKLVGDAYNEDVMLPHHLDANDMTASFFVYFLRMMLGYLFGELDYANDALTEARGRLTAILAKLENSVFNFYESLLGLALLSRAGSEENEARILQQIENNQIQMQAWANSAPMNFEHKFLLVEAERHRVLNNHQSASRLYGKSIELAQQNDYLNEAALACELAGKHALGLGDDEQARHYLGKACQVYSEWGAAAKLRHLLAEYPHLVEAPGSVIADSRVSDGTESAAGEMEKLDLHSVLKAATAISEEIVLSRLLERLMQILLQSAGAQRGVIVLEQDGQLFIEAEAAVAQESVNIQQHVPLDQATQLPRQVMQYVARTKEPVVIGSSSDHARFPGDAYLTCRKNSSILCTPIVNRGKLLGLLYIENHLFLNAFTHERTELLRLISGQIAVSLNNAQLFDELEQRVATRTAKLEAANRELERLTNLDGLTELFNRRFFDFSMAREWDRLRRLSKPISLIFCDVDFFKQFNDAQGHLAGDDCLRKVAQTLRHCTRRPTDVAARYGGEEFVVLLPETDEAGACAIAETMRLAILELAIPHPASRIQHRHYCHRELRRRYYHSCCS